MTIYCLEKFGQSKLQNGLAKLIMIGHLTDQLQKIKTCSDMYVCVKIKICTFSYKIILCGRTYVHVYSNISCGTQIYFGRNKCFVVLLRCTSCGNCTE